MPSLGTSVGGSDKIASLAYVQREIRDKQSNLIVVPLPGSAQPFGFGFMGAQGSLTIEGIFNDTNANCLTFANNLDSLCDGSQSNNVYYTSDFRGSFTTPFLVDNINTTVEGADIKPASSATNCVVRYTIRLVDVSAT